MTGIAVSSLIGVTITLTPTPAQFAPLNSCLILGDSNIIDVKQRYRTYTTLAAVATDFGTTAPEYLAAKDWFAQLPQPTNVTIGRWAKAATSGLVLGGVLSASQQALSNFTGINNGGFHINIDGAGSQNVTGIDLTGQTNLNGVASQIQTALRAIGTGGFTAATCVWNSTYKQFEITSGTTGTSSSVSALTAPAAGTDLSPLINMTAATLAYTQAGITAESAVACVTLFDTSIANYFYGLQFAVPANDLSTNDILAVAAYIEGAAAAHLFGYTSSDTTALLPTDTTSVGYQVSQLGYNRTFSWWSSFDPYAVSSALARLLTVNWLGSNTAITLMYKQMPGVAGETLNSTQQAALNANHWNYYGIINNGTTIILNGWAASGQFLDTIFGADWLANYIQTNYYNALYTTSTKIPQTNAGINQLQSTVAASCAQGVANGLLGPGTWNAGGFGQLKTGDFLDKGYYIYTPPLSSQPQSQRAARQAPLMQVAAKLAGAVHTGQVAININP